MMSNFGTRHRRNVSILLSLRRNRDAIEAANKILVITATTLIPLIHDGFPLLHIRKQQDPVLPILIMDNEVALGKFFAGRETVSTPLEVQDSLVVTVCGCPSL